MGMGMENTLLGLLLSFGFGIADNKFVVCYFFVFFFGFFIQVKLNFTTCKKYKKVQTCLPGPASRERELLVPTYILKNLRLGPANSHMGLSDSHFANRFFLYQLSLNSCNNFFCLAWFCAAFTNLDCVLLHISLP